MHDRLPVTNDYKAVDPIGTPRSLHCPRLSGSSIAANGSFRSPRFVVSATSRALIRAGQLPLRAQEAPFQAVGSRPHPRAHAARQCFWCFPGLCPRLFCVSSLFLVRPPSLGGIILYTSTPVSQWLLSFRRPAAPCSGLLYCRGGPPETCRALALLPPITQPQEAH